MRHQHRHRHRCEEHTAFSAAIALLGVLGLFASIGCGTSSSSSNNKDGGAAAGGKTTGGANNGASANEGSGGNAANGGTVSGASGGTANAASGGTASGGASTGGTANGGTANGGRSNSGGASSGGRSTGAGGASNGGASNGGAGNGGATSTAGATNDSGAPMLIDQYVTFYGWPDNDPPGNGIAYPGLHKAAGGTGTYADPITFATDPTEWKPGTILYLPFLKRYVIMEDSCAECITDWKTRKYHIDIWLESNGSFDSQVLACEDTLTRSKTSVEIDPPPDRPVDATPLFDTKSGTCNPPP